ncbi:MAG: 50S ribosomal protein L24 [Candidatus Baltobacteraceae bacterium]
MASKPRIIKGDAVLIRRGKERGKRGTVKEIDAQAGVATVEGINIVKRHTKSGSKQGNTGGSMQTGGIIEKESPLPLSALQYVCEKCKAPTRLRRGRSTDGAVHRICVRCGEPARESAKGA